SDVRGCARRIDHGDWVASGASRLGAGLADPSRFSSSGVIPMGFQSKIVPEQILRVEDVTVSVDGLLVLKNLNFSMERGELGVVIGPNGAGKTTLLDVITGKIRPAKGRDLVQQVG